MNTASKTSPINRLLTLLLSLLTAFVAMAYCYEAWKNESLSFSMSMVVCFLIGSSIFMPFLITDIVGKEKTTFLIKR